MNAEQLSAWLKTALRAIVIAAHHLGVQFENIEKAAADVIADAKQDVETEVKKLETKV